MSNENQIRYTECKNSIHEECTDSGAYYVSIYCNSDDDLQGYSGLYVYVTTYPRM